MPRLYAWFLVSGDQVMEHRNTNPALCRYCRGVQNAFHKLNTTEKYSGIEIAVVLQNGRFYCEMR